MEKCQFAFLLQFGLENWQQSLNLKKTWNYTQQMAETSGMVLSYREFFVRTGLNLSVTANLIWVLMKKRSLVSMKNNNPQNRKGLRKLTSDAILLILR